VHLCACLYAYACSRIHVCTVLAGLRSLLKHQKSNVKYCMHSVPLLPWSGPEKYEGRHVKSPTFTTGSVDI
jgi:hypothetical protein